VRSSGGQKELTAASGEGFGRETKLKREAGQVVPPPFFPLSGNPASLTEGDQPVVCWPVYIIPESQKKFL
jgi:hypothetical protein